MKKEKDGTGSCGPAGEGGCFKRYKVERDKAVREKAAFVESAEASVRAADDRLTALKKDKIAKEVELENILDKARLAGREIEIDPRTNSLDVAAELPKKSRTCSRRSDNTALNSDRRSMISETSSRLTSTRASVSGVANFYLLH